MLQRVLRLVLGLVLWHASGTAEPAHAELDPDTVEKVPVVGAQRPSLLPPLGLLVTGAATMAIGGALLATTNENTSEARDRAGPALLGVGAGLVLASSIHMAVRIRKRIRFSYAETRERCLTTGVGCPDQRPPALYPPLFLFVPGVALTLGGGLLLGLQTPPDADPFFRMMGWVLLGTGTALLVGSAVYLGLRVAKRAQFRREHPELRTGLRVVPSVESQGGRFSAGLLLTKRF